MIMRDTIFCAVGPEVYDEGQDAVAESVHQMVAAVQEYVPGYRLLQDPQFDPPTGVHPRPDQGERLHRGRGRGRLPAAVLRQPRHHDRRRDPRRRRDGTAHDASSETPRSTQLDRTWSDDLDIRLTDTCLRDGSHHKRHQFTAEEVRSVIAALDDAGVPVLEVTHGDGLGGSSFNYGFSQHPRAGADQDRRRDGEAREDRLPDAARRRHQGRHPRGAGQRRRRSAGSPPTAPRPTSREQHFTLARELGPGDGRLPDDEPHPAARGAREAGADHGRRGLPVRLRRRLRRRADHGGRRRPGLRAGRARSAPRPPSASTATRTSTSAVANTVMAVRAGATQIDGSVRRFGAGAGNTPLDAFVGVCDKLGWRTGVDFMKIIDASEDVVRPAMPEECQLDRMTMMMGYAGVYSSLPQARRQRRRALRRLRRADPADRGGAQADRRPGGPADRHRAGAEGQAGRRRLTVED